MKRKERTKGIVIGMLLMLLLVSSVSVFATGQVSKKLDVLYNNIKLVIDGKPVEFGKDSVGAKIEPFIYNGTTYLPVRAVGEAMGKKVGWDGKSQTVYLGEMPGDTGYLTEILSAFESKNITTFKLNQPTKIQIAGKEFNTGYGKYDYNVSILRFNLDSKYKELNFSYGPYKYFTDSDGTMNIYLDDSLSHSINVAQGDGIKDIKIDVTGVNQLRIELEYASGKTFIAIGDPIIK